MSIQSTKAAASAAAHIRQALAQLENVDEDLREKMYQSTTELFNQHMIDMRAMGPLTMAEREALNAFRRVIWGGGNGG